MDTATFFYIAGGALCVVAITLSFVGLRNESFPPSRGTLLGGLAIVFLIVVTASTGAVLSAREEQKHRRAELALSAEEEAANEGAGDEAPVEEGTTPEQPAEDAPAKEGAPPAPETADVDAAALFTSNGCGSCHTLGAAGSEGVVGPSLDEVLPGQSPEQVRGSIVDPSAELAKGFGDGIMPPNFGTAMTEVEIDALVAYLLENAG